MRVSKAPQVKNRQTEWDFDKDGLSGQPNPPAPWAEELTRRSIP